jgi:hypothetical protein
MYRVCPDPPHNPIVGDIWMCPELHNTFIWSGSCWNTCDVNETDVQNAMIDDIIKTNRQKLGYGVDPGISPNDFDSYTFLVWLKVATPEDLEAYNRLGQNFRVSTAYAKGLIEEPEPEPEPKLLESVNSLDEDFEKEVMDIFQKALEWKVQEVMDDYEDELEAKLLFDVLTHNETQHYYTNS